MHEVRSRHLLPVRLVPVSYLPVLPVVVEGRSHGPYGSFESITVVYNLYQQYQMAKNNSRKVYTKLYTFQNSSLAVARPLRFPEKVVVYYINSDKETTKPSAGCYE